MESEFSVPRGYTLLTEKELKELMEKADAWDEWMESDKQTLDMLADKHHAVRTILYDFCDYYGTETLTPQSVRQAFTLVAVF